MWSKPPNDIIVNVVAKGDGSNEGPKSDELVKVFHGKRLSQVNLGESL
jgi:hypothetical protein